MGGRGSNSGLSSKNATLVNQQEYIKKENKMLAELNAWLASKSKVFEREDGTGNLFEKYTIKGIRAQADDGYGNLGPDSALAIKYKDGTVMTKMEGESLEDIKWKNIEGITLDIGGVTTGVYGKVYFKNLFDFEDGEYYWDADVEP